MLCCDSAPTKVWPMHAPLFGYIPKLKKSAHVSVGQLWSIDLQPAVLSALSQLVLVDNTDAHNTSLN